MHLLRARPKLLSFDSEATGIFPFLGDRAFSWSMCDPDLKTKFWRAPVDPLTRSVGDFPDSNELWDALADERVTKIFHNAHYDMRMAEIAGHPVRGAIEDTLSMSRVLFTLQKASLKSLGELWLEIPVDDEVALHEATKIARVDAEVKGWKVADDSGRWGRTPWMADFWLAPKPLLERYNRLDSERTILLWHLLGPQLDAEPRLRKSYSDTRELSIVTYEMMGTGVRCRRDSCRFEWNKAEMQRRMHQQNLTGLVKKSGFSIDRKVAKKVDPSGVQKSYDINVNSPQQVQKLVYGHLGFPVLETTDSGQPATGAEALRTFDHPIVREIVTVKSMLNTQKFFKTYLLHSIANAEGPGVDILHPTFNQDGAKTRRYSAKDPNLQNVPNAITTKSVMPIQARIPFGPRPGKVWIHNDWSQEELRIFAAESGDQALLADLATGDIFTVATNRILGKRINPQTGQVEHYDIVAEEAKVNKKTSRSKIKILSYGIIYGGGADAASRSLGCSRAEAQALLDQYHETYHRIRPFMDDLISLAGQQGYIWNRFNWRMEVNKEYAYQAVNYLIQSSAAAYLKSKLVWLWKYYRAHPEIGARIVMTIHDEIVTEVEEAKILPHLSIIKAELENHHGIWPEIPNLPVEFKMARERWDVQEHMEVA